MPGQTNPPGGNAYCCSYTDPTLLTKQDCEDKCNADVGRCVAYSWKRSYTDCNLYDAAALPDLAEVVGSRSLSPPLGHWDANCYISYALFERLEPPAPPPADCDCNYDPGGCSISKAAPEGKACKCVYKGGFTCGGDVVSCGNPESPKCTAPDKSVGSCTMGGGDCGGYSGSQDCDCDYKFKFLGGGCKISQAAPKHTACECSYKGAFTCDGEVVQCRDDWDPLCLNPDLSETSCNLAAGSDCDGY